MRLNRLALLATALSSTFCTVEAAQGPIGLALDAFELFGNASRGAVKGVLTGVFKMNGTAVDAFLTSSKKTLPAHPYALDLTDENFDNVLSTGTYSPFARELPDDTVWVILVHGPDLISRKLVDAFNEVALKNSSQAGGQLPEHMRFARLDYNEETYLTTLWWIWKPPVMVIMSHNAAGPATTQLELRFFNSHMLIPHAEPLANLLNNPKTWQSVRPWQGMFGIGEDKSARFMHPIGKAWTWYHQTVRRIPNFLILMFSGFVMNFVVGWFHDPETKAKERAAEKERLKAQIAKEQEQDAALKKKAGPGSSTALPGPSSAKKRKV